MQTYANMFANIFVTEPLRCIAPSSFMKLIVRRIQTKFLWAPEAHKWAALQCGYEDSLLNNSVHSVVVVHEFALASRCYMRLGKVSGMHFHWHLAIFSISTRSQHRSSIVSGSLVLYVGLIESNRCINCRCMYKMFFLNHHQSLHDNQLIIFPFY